MPRRFVFDPPDRFVAGTIGPAGNRTFYLQARAGERIASVSLEKVQVAVLAERLGALLDELERRGIVSTIGVAADDGPLDEPMNELFRANALTLAWDADTERIVIEAREAASPEDDDEPDDEPDDDEEEAEDADADAMVESSDAEAAREAAIESLAAAALDAAASLANDDSDVMSVHLEPSDARGFVAVAGRVIAAGRPPCPFCGQPLDPQGHLCPRRNGNRLN
jgi:uncharacterized repeat protein (TIGR03847 family)